MEKTDDIYSSNTDNLFKCIDDNNEINHFCITDYRRIFHDHGIDSS